MSEFELEPISDDEDNISNVTKEEEEEIHFPRRYRAINRHIEKELYTPDEISGMSDFTLLKEFRRITGCQQLRCSHCAKKQKKLHDGWIKSIRRRCMKREGLHRNMKLPKTCDIQSSVNSICNPINNPCYQVMRNAESFSTISNIQTIREIQLEQVGIRTKPYRYVDMCRR